MWIKPPRKKLQFLGGLSTLSGSGRSKSLIQIKQAREILPEIDSP